MDKIAIDDDFLELEHEEEVLRQFEEDTMTDNEIEQEEVEQEESEQEEVEQEESEQEEVDEDDFEAPLLGSMGFLKMDINCDNAMKAMIYAFAAELIILGVISFI
jgi:CO dehydrogenase/acetyl-CoA synthase beta subunit